MIPFILWCGLIATSGLGESNPGYWCAADVHTHRLFISLDADTLNKTESNSGWLMSTTADMTLVRTGFVRPFSGIRFTRRDGGTWVKHRMGARIGLALGETARLTLESEVYQFPFKNDVRSFEWRTTSKRLDVRTAVYHHNRGWGSRIQFGVLIFNHQV